MSADDAGDGGNHDVWCEILKLNGNLMGMGGMGGGKLNEKFCFKGNSLKFLLILFKISKNI